MPPIFIFSPQSFLLSPNSSPDDACFLNKPPFPRRSFFQLKPRCVCLSAFHIFPFPSWHAGSWIKLFASICLICRELSDVTHILFMQAKNSVTQEVLQNSVLSLNRLRTTPHQILAQSFLNPDYFIVKTQIMRIDKHVFFFLHGRGGCLCRITLLMAGSCVRKKYSRVFTGPVHSM